MRIPCLVALALVPALSHAAGSRAEIQVQLCEPPQALAGKLALRTRGAPYETWLFDDASLALLDLGIRLRLRMAPSGGDLTLKAAKQDCRSLPREAIPDGEGKCEYDLHGDTLDGAVSLTRSLDAATTRDLLAGKVEVGSALSAAQVRYLRDTMRAWPLPAGLRPLGPIANRVYASARYDVDVSTLPDGRPYAEISDKVPLDRATQARDKLMRHLARAGVEVCASQEGQAADKMKRLLGK